MKRSRTAWALALLVAVTACGDDSVAAADAASPHVQVNELFLRTADNATFARTEMIDRRWAPERITLRADEGRAVRVVYLGFDNREFTLDGARMHQTRGTVEGTAVRWVADGAHGRLEAVHSGIARFRVSVFHIDHTDFDSPWLTIEVPAP